MAIPGTNISTHPRRALLVAIGMTVIVATACGSTSDVTVPTIHTEPAPSSESEIPGSIPFEIDIFKELNPQPDLLAVDIQSDLGFNMLGGLPRDAITPVYNPKFITPDEVGESLVADELVMGLNIDGDARAYPVGIMRFREMVNDEVGGVPLLITW